MNANDARTLVAYNAWANRLEQYPTVAAIEARRAEIEADQLRQLGHAPPAADFIRFLTCG